MRCVQSRGLSEPRGERGPGANLGWRGNQPVQLWASLLCPIRVWRPLTPEQSHPGTQSPSRSRGAVAPSNCDVAIPLRTSGPRGPGPDSQPVVSSQYSCRLSLFPEVAAALWKAVTRGGGGGQAWEGCHSRFQGSLLFIVAQLRALTRINSHFKSSAPGKEISFIFFLSGLGASRIDD